jgi:RNA polymerase sigma-54 factor
MGLEITQQLRQSQRLVMTPQMQQSIALLQMNSLELEQHLEGELLENPFLEIGDNGEEEDQLADSEGEVKDQEAPGEGRDDSNDGENTPETASADDMPDLQDSVSDADQKNDDDQTDLGEVDVDFDQLFDDLEPRLSVPNVTETGDEENDFTTYTALEESLYDNLKKQLALSSLEGKDFEVGEYIIGLLGDDGYLKTPVEDIAEEFEMEPCDVEDILAVIQSFEPTGIAARSLPECISLQMEELGVKERIYYKVINNHFTELQSKKFKDISKALDIPESKISEIFHFVIKLDPHPGRKLAPNDTRYIKPDVVVKEVDGEYMFFVNEGRTGKLRINKFYRDLLKSKKKEFQAEGREFAMNKFKNAVWLIKNIEKRKGTVLRVTEAIMEFQSEFLEKGVEALRPLTLKEIAVMVDMHESTIARVTTGKYVETPRGTFELKYFFSSGLETEDGPNASSRSIKEKIRQIIDDENPKKPLSDQKIANILQEDGLKIARRTVAKYREQLKYLPAKLRKAV